MKLQLDLRGQVEFTQVEKQMEGILKAGNM